MRRGARSLAGVSDPRCLCRKSYRNLGLFWLGSLMMSIVVFLLGNLIGMGVRRGAQLHLQPLLVPPGCLHPPVCPAGLLPGRGGRC